MDKWKTYECDKGSGERFYLDGDTVTYGSNYYTLDGEKLDLPYHGKFIDGHCFYTEDGKTLCMDIDGTITDYTDEVKTITDNGMQIIALIDNTYFVAQAYSNQQPVWFDKDGNTITRGTPYEVNGKYITNGFASIYSYQMLTYVNMSDTSVQSGNAMIAYTPKEWGADAVLTDEHAFFHTDDTYTDADINDYSYFYNGISLATAGRKAFFINTKFEKISDEFETGNQPRVEYIGNGQFALYQYSTEFGEGKSQSYLFTPEF